MNKGTRLRVWIEVELPVDATNDQVEEWLKFELHAGNSIKLSNPLEVFELEANSMSFHEGV